MSLEEVESLPPPLGEGWGGVLCMTWYKIKIPASNTKRGIISSVKLYLPYKDGLAHLPRTN